MRTNNLGGFKAIELLFADEVTSFVRTGYEVAITRNTATRRLLPLSDQLPELSTIAEEDESGYVYTHECTVYLRSRDLTDEQQKELRQMTHRGCILIAHTSNGDNRVFGTPTYPLFGTLMEDYGTSRTDLHQYELKLTAKLLHRDLTLSE